MYSHFPPLHIKPLFLNLIKKKSRIIRFGRQLHCKGELFTWFQYYNHQLNFFAVLHKPHYYYGCMFTILLTLNLL